MVLYSSDLSTSTLHSKPGTPLSSLCSWAKYCMAKLQPNATTDHYHYITTFPVAAVGLLFVSLAPLVVVGVCIACWAVADAGRLRAGARGGGWWVAAL